MQGVEGIIDSDEQWEDREQTAYHHGCQIFELALEYGCGAGGNGHHQAQYFAAMIKKLNFNQEDA